MRGLRNHLLFFGIALLVLVADQASKALVQWHLPLGESFPSYSWVRLTHIENSGAAFGLLAGQGPLLAVTATIGIVALLLYYRFPAFSGAYTRLALGLQLGGATGNLVDRLRLGYVVDFIDFRVWPIFNLADSAIVVGVLLVATLLLFAPHPDAASSSEPSSPN